MQVNITFSEKRQGEFMRVGVFVRINTVSVLSESEKIQNFGKSEALIIKSSAYLELQVLKISAYLEHQILKFQRIKSPEYYNITILGA